MDEIERRIRAARPVSGNRNLPLSDRAKRELADLLISESHSGPDKGARRRLSIGRLVTLVAVFVVVTAVGILGPWRLGSVAAQAATPPMLPIDHLTATGPETLLELAQIAAHAPADEPGEGGQVIRVRSWALHVVESDDEVGQFASVIHPENYEITLPADGSMRTVVTAGQAYDQDGTLVSGGPALGTVLWSLELSPSEYVPMFSRSAPTQSDLFGTFLSAGSGLNAQTRGSDALLAISYLLMEQTLNGSQTSAALRYLATLPDIGVAGTTTDRLGRPAIALEAEREDGNYNVLLLVDPATGQILAFETVYIGTSRTDIKAPAVTEYQAWEKDQ